jgi:hypothetical protein
MAFSEACRAEEDGARPGRDEDGPVVSEGFEAWHGWDAAMNALNEKAQAAAVRRDVVRRHVASLATAIEDEINFENTCTPDDPECRVYVHVDISMTLAKDLVKSLRAAEVMI